MLVTKEGSNHTWDVTHRYWYCELAGYDVVLSEREVARLVGEDRLPCGCDAYANVVQPEPILVTSARRDA